MSANFELWRFDSLVSFARDTVKRIKELEEENAGLVADRRALLAELRKMMLKEADRDTGSQG